MSIYPDKKAGRLTGRFAVEVMVRGKRYKGRFDTRPEAEAQERRWKASPPTLDPTPQPPPQPALQPSQEPTEGACVMFSEARAQAPGRSFLWAGLASEQGSLDRLRIIEEVMGDRTLALVDDEYVEDLKDKLADERDQSPATVNRYLATLSKLLQWSKKKKWIAALPEITWLGIDGHRIRWFNHEEEARMYAAEDAQGVVLVEPYRKLIRLAINTGMRRGEILSLEPNQVRPGWVDLWVTKSKRPRAIPLAAQDEADLRELAEGAMPTKQQLRTRWRRLRKAMGLEADPDFVFHACRHTCATRMALGLNPTRKKVDPLTIQRWMGHGDLATTMRYIHLADDVLQDALEDMNRVAS